MQDLEEFAGVTEELLAAYLGRNGYAQATYHQTSDHWQKREGRVLYQINVQQIERSVHLLATWSKRSPQAILRDINPRLRKGCPSPADRAAHTGYWLAVSPTSAGYMVKFDERRHGGDPGFEVYRSSSSGNPASPFYDPGCSYNVSDFRGGLAEWSFWPCDAHGNKVPWPIPPSPARDGEVG